MAFESLYVLIILSFSYMRSLKIFFFRFPCLIPISKWTSVRLLLRFSRTNRNWSNLISKNSLWKFTGVNLSIIKWPESLKFFWKSMVLLIWSSCTFKVPSSKNLVLSVYLKLSNMVSFSNWAPTQKSSKFSTKLFTFLNVSQFRDFIWNSSKFGLSWRTPYKTVKTASRSRSWYYIVNFLRGKFFLYSKVCESRKCLTKAENFENYKFNSIKF